MEFCLVLGSAHNIDICAFSQVAKTEGQRADLIKYFLQQKLSHQRIHARNNINFAILEKNGYVNELPLWVQKTPQMEYDESRPIAVKKSCVKCKNIEKEKCHILQTRELPKVIDCQNCDLFCTAINGHFAARRSDSFF